MAQDQRDVAVIIAAMNASATIGRAVASALADPHVREVVVVDDGSSDPTADAARAVDDGSGRLAILSFLQNRGPSAARNHALANSSAPLVAILDADDFFLPGRFDALKAEGDWDMAADDILFVPQARMDEGLPAIPDAARPADTLDAVSFIEGNISRRGRSRGEIGFLKPVMSRAFLERNGLAYRQELRLGEDYELYVRALIAGARYKVVHHCGYGAVVRADSLSGRHRTEDLYRLWQADLALLQGQLAAPVRAALARHAAHIAGRYELRRFLDDKAGRGLLRAGVGSLGRPAALPSILGGVANDKAQAIFGRFRRPAAEPDHRLLLKDWRAP